MKLLLCLALLVPVASAATCAGAGSAGPQPGAAAETTKATKMIVLRSAFYEPQIVMLKSYPPQFQLVLKRKMPTPGWTFQIDEVDVDEAAGRVVARVTETGPDGIVAQVITETQCRIPLGTVAGGDYIVEVWSRRDAGQPHRPVQAFVLSAS
jgi:hypothetical protein